MVRGACIGAVLLSVGCGGDEARRYAVTFTDSPTIACAAAGIDDLFKQDREAIEKSATALQKEWKVKYLANPPRPVGRELVVSATEGAVEAWLDEPLSTQDRFGTRYFSGRDEVLTGTPHDDYIDVTFALVINTDQADEEDHRPLCGDRTFATSALLVTEDGGAVEGRLRRVEILYPTTTFVSCTAHITCARNLAALGAELAGP